MRFTMLPQVFSQLFKKPWTNKFPAKYIPSNTTEFLKEVKKEMPKSILLLKHRLASEEKSSMIKTNASAVNFV